LIMAVAGPATPVTSNRIDGSGGMSAVTTLRPAEVPISQVETLATPDEFVIAAEFEIAPDPSVMEKFTTAPTTGAPFTSFTRTDGGVATAVPTVAVSLTGETATMEAAATLPGAGVLSAGGAAGAEGSAQAFANVRRQMASNAATGRDMTSPCVWLGVSHVAREGRTQGNEKSHSITTQTA
jgi:hypothetical protein